MKIDLNDAILLLVDFQQRLMPFIYEKERIEEKLLKLINGCKIFEVPIIVTQQYTKGLGESLPSIKESLPVFEPIEKTTFSCCGAPEFLETLAKTGRKTIILTGIETHICVLQTAFDLWENGYEIFLVSDCTGSRDVNDKKYAEERMRDEGVMIATMESVLFEMCVDSKNVNFKNISNLVK